MLVLTKVSAQLSSDDLSGGHGRGVVHPGRAEEPDGTGLLSFKVDRSNNDRT